MDLTGNTALADPPGDSPWWRDLIGQEHAVSGSRTACGAIWTPLWTLIGGIRDVDRSRACPSCITRTGSTEAELAGGHGR